MDQTTRNTQLVDAANRYRSAGLCPLPAHRNQKRPSLTQWAPFQERLPSHSELGGFFTAATDAVCVLTGCVSGNLEMIDFDHGAELFDKWSQPINVDLLNRLVIETSQSGGKHVIYRCESEIAKNSKLAQRKIGDGIQTLIETRGNGGLFLCAPTRGYEPLQGSLEAVPVITSAEREELIFAAQALNEHWKQPFGKSSRLQSSSFDTRPGDEFNERGNVAELLIKHGWHRTFLHHVGNQHWTRPGKQHGTSATLKDRVLFVFSTNAAPFEGQSSYSPFAVYALLEHHGDFSAAARALSVNGYGQPSQVNDVDLTAMLPVQSNSQDSDREADPGYLPEEWLRIPGFMSQIMDHCLATAPYPNVAMAFAGALALQSFLAGRKVRDPGDNRSNIYLLGLAHSSAGKDWPRKVNVQILHQIGQSDRVGDRFASGEGIQDALFLHPSTLFQTDEIDGILQSINRARDARHESIMSTLLTLYSSSNTVFPMRRRAGKEVAGVIDQPCLTLFGTAIPNHYYEALSERMLTNGLFARMIILECGQRGPGQEPRIQDLPDEVIEQAKWWADLKPGNGNLASTHPEPIVIQQSRDAQEILIEARLEAENEYAKAETMNDAVGTTVWGRVSEQSRKLALIYAVSENCRDPLIGQAAAQWAVRFVMHQTKRMLFMAKAHVADSPFDAECLKFMQKLREQPDRSLEHSRMLKRMKMDARSFSDIAITLEQRGDIQVVTKSTAGRPSRCYRLLESAQ